GAAQAMFLHKVKLTAAAVLGLGVFAVGTNTLMHAQVKTNDTRTQRVASELPPDEAKLREEKLNQFLAGKLPGDEFFLPTLSEAEYNALFAQFKGTDKMKSLLKEQLDAAQVENNTRYKEFLAGRGTLSTYIGASVRLLSVELMLSTKQDDLVNA